MKWIGIGHQKIKPEKLKMLIFWEDILVLTWNKKQMFLDRSIALFSVSLPTLILNLEVSPTLATRINQTLHAKCLQRDPTVEWQGHVADDDRPDRLRTPVSLSFPIDRTSPWWRRRDDTTRNEAGPWRRLPLSSKRGLYEPENRRRVTKEGENCTTWEGNSRITTCIIVSLRDISREHAEIDVHRDGIERTVAVRGICLFGFWNSNESSMKAKYQVFFIYLSCGIHLQLNNPKYTIYRVPSKMSFTF